MGVGSKDSVPAGFPKKNSGLAPEGLSIRTGIGGRSPAIVVSHNGPKNQNYPGGTGGLPPWRFFSPFLCVKKGGGPQARPIFAGRVGVCPHIQNAVLTKRDIQCTATSFLRVEKGRKETPGASPPGPRRICRFSLHENRRVRHLLNRRSYNKGARGPRESGGHHFIKL